MVSVAEAESVILAHVARLPAEDCPLLEAHGRVLRRPVLADRDLPPFDRVTMDGYALRASALAAGRRHFQVTAFQPAGVPPLTLGPEETAIEIATGAVLPVGADVVIPYEETEAQADIARGRTVEPFQAYTVAVTGSVDAPPGRHIHRRGSDHVAGDLLIAPGTRIGGGEIAVAASCGVPSLSVAAQPSVAIVATGDELVDIDATALAPHQLRRSNDYALRAALRQSGLVGAVERVHLRDDPAEVETRLRELIERFDVVLLTGGVSKGRLDFLPHALNQLGVERRLRGVAQRPGKPMWFGTTTKGRPIFALPGNPVSAYTCLHRYVLPALGLMAGLPPSPPTTVVLAEPVTFHPPLTYFLPVLLQDGRDGRQMASPAPFNTSGDFAGLVGTAGFVELPAERTTFEAGSIVRFWRWT